MGLGMVANNYKSEWSRLDDESFKDGSGTPISTVSSSSTTTTHQRPVIIQETTFAIERTPADATRDSSSPMF